MHNAQNAAKNIFLLDEPTEGSAGFRGHMEDNCRLMPSPATVAR